MIQTDNVTGVPMPEIKTTGEALSSLKGLSIDDAISKIANGLVSFGFKLMIAILVFYVGRFIIRKIYQTVYNIMVSRKVDPSLTTFVLSLVKMVLYFILIITVVGILGIETGSFLALFASAGVAIGMALSGTLQNFAGGVLLLLLKPYKVGDYIEAQGFAGTVKEIQIFHTVINTPDNKAIIIPNGGLSTSSINNYSLEEYRRVDWSIGLSYGADFEKAKEAILDILKSDDRVVVTTIDADIAHRKAKALEALAASAPTSDSVGAAHDDSSAAQTPTEEELEEKCGDDKACREELTSSPIKKINWWKRWMLHRRETRKIEQKAIERRMSKGILTSDNRPPFVSISELADSSVNFTIRAWTHTSNYWPLYFEMNERFYTELPKRGFSFPFPQMDVHMVPEQ